MSTHNATFFFFPLEKQEIYQYFLLGKKFYLKLYEMYHCHILLVIAIVSEKNIISSLSDF